MAAAFETRHAHKTVAPNIKALHLQCSWTVPPLLEGIPGCLSDGGVVWTNSPGLEQLLQQEATNKKSSLSSPFLGLGNAHGTTVWARMDDDLVLSTPPCSPFLGASSTPITEIPEHALNRFGEVQAKKPSSKFHVVLGDVAEKRPAPSSLAQQSQPHALDWNVMKCMVAKLVNGHDNHLDAVIYHFIGEALFTSYAPPRMPTLESIQLRRALFEHDPSDGDGVPPANLVLVHTLLHGAYDTWREIPEMLALILASLLKQRTELTWPIVPHLECLDQVRYIKDVDMHIHFHASHTTLSQHLFGMPSSSLYEEAYDIFQEDDVAFSAHTEGSLIPLATQSRADNISVRWSTSPTNTSSQRDELQRIRVSICAPRRSETYTLEKEMILFVRDDDGGGAPTALHYGIRGDGQPTPSAQLKSTPLLEAMDERFSEFKGAFLHELLDLHALLRKHELPSPTSSAAKRQRDDASDQSVALVALLAACKPRAEIVFAPLMPPQLPSFEQITPTMSDVLLAIGTLRATALAKYTEMQQRNLRREQTPYLMHGGAPPVPKKTRHLPRSSTVGFPQTLQAASTGYPMGGAEAWPQHSTC